MKGQDIKKGDVVSIIDRSKNELFFVTETEAVSVGRKYIVTKHCGNTNKFGIDTHYSEYLGYMLYKGNEAECREYIKEKNEANLLVRDIVRFFEYGDPDPKLVKEVYQMIKEK